MQAVLRVLGAMVLAGLLGLALGLGTGWLTLGRETAVPDEVPPAGPALAPAIALAAVPTPSAGVDMAKLMAETPKAAPPQKPLPPVANAPDVLEEMPLVGDPSLLPRGPGKTALLDLESAGLATLQVRAGSLARDGAANWAKFAKNPRVATLQGPQARVELLHLGFDAEARPILAHVRTVDDARVEGVIALQAGDVRVPVLADPDPPALAPPSQKGPPEDE